MVGRVGFEVESVVGGGGGLVVASGHAGSHYAHQSSSGPAPAAHGKKKKNMFLAVAWSVAWSEGRKVFLAVVERRAAPLEIS